MAPKAKKGTTMSLADFLHTDQVKDISDESWADDAFHLPTGPRAMAGGVNELPSGPAASHGSSGGGGFDRRRPGRFAEPSHGGSSAPATIDQSRLPSSPPYTAFIGNLSFDVTEGDIRTFFQMRGISAQAIVQVKLPRDPSESRSRGFGYVEFGNLEDLTRALLASNQHSVNGRVVRIDVSDSKPGDMPPREPRPSEANNNWRDGATSVSGSSFAARRDGEQRDSAHSAARPVSAAENSMNWRDGAHAVTAAGSARTSAAPASAPRKSGFDSANEKPAFGGNWRDSARPVEKSATPISAAASTESVKQPEQQPKKTVSRAPDASNANWRRSAA